MAGIQQLMKFIPMAQGSAAKVTLGAKQLQQLAAKNPQAKVVVEKYLAKLENPSLEVAYKAKSNYAIAGLTLKDGKNIVGTGAVSITNPGSSQAVVKYRLNQPAGRANGFIDGGKVARTDDAAISLARKGGNVKADVQISDAMAHHIQVNEQQAVDLAKDFGANNFLEKYVQGTRNLQKGADAMMTNIRKLFRGEPIKEPLTLTKVTKVAPEAIETRIKRADFTKADLTKYANIDKIMSTADKHKLPKETMDKLLAEINANPEITAKKLKSTDINKLINKFKNQA